jgi:hypothetical protein
MTIEIDNRESHMIRKMNNSKVSVGPSGSGALSSRFGEKGVWMRKNLVFLGGLAIVVALAAMVG